MSSTSSCWDKFNEHTITCNKIVELKREIEVLRKFGIAEKVSMDNEIDDKKTMLNFMRTDLLKQRMYMETFCPKLYTFCTFFSRCEP